MSIDPRRCTSCGAAAGVLLAMALHIGCTTSRPASETDPVPEMPQVPASRRPEGPFEGMYSWIGRDQAPLGRGRLHPTRVDDYGAAWVGGIALPLHDAPNARVWGWIVNGWFVENGVAQPFEMDGMVETEYELLSFVVEEERDAWLRIRFGGPSARDGGLAWVSRDHLAIGDVTMFYQPWPELFLTDLVSPQYFRGPGPWPVHDAPDGEVRTEIASRDHAIYVLETRSDWMRVRVRQPSDYCTDPPRVEEVEGWIRWWTRARGSEIWYYTRGC